MKLMMIQLLLLAALSSCATGKLPSTPANEVPVNTEVTEPVQVEKPYEPVTVFTYKSSLTWVKKVNECANKIVNDKEFQAELLAKEKFDYSGDSGEVVLGKLLNHKCVIRTYKTKSPWTRVVATTYRSNKTDLYLNRRKSRTIAQWSGTSIHECSHNFGYSHGDNSSAGKQQSVPYWIGYAAERHAKRICQQ